MSRLAATAFLGVTMLASACTRPAEPPATSASPTRPVTGGERGTSLEGTSWQLTYVAGRAWPVGAARDVTLTFNKRRLRGFGGCNEYGARWEMSGRRLDIGRIAMTLILCEGEVAWVESRLLSILAASPRASVQPSELRLTAHPEGVIVFAPRDA